MMKAGLIEFASIIVINKSDRPGSKKMKVILDQVVSFNNNEWSIPVVDVIAIKDSNINKLCRKISNHHSFLNNNNLITKKNNQKYIQSIKTMIEDYSIKRILDSESMMLIEKELTKPKDEVISPQEMFLRLRK